MNILSEIRSDHIVLRRLIGQLERTSKRQSLSRERGFRKLRSIFGAHIQAEEATVYRILLENRDARSEVRESYEAHHLISLLINEMSALSVRDKVWEAKLAVLREMLETHIEEVETNIFAYTRKAISDKRAIKEMGIYYRTLFREKMPVLSGEVDFSPDVYRSEFPRP